MRSISVSWLRWRWSLMQAHDEYDRMIAGEADLKARMEEMKKNHEAEIGDLKLESAELSRKVVELRLTKIWLLTEGAQLLAKHIHKGPEMTQAVVAFNNAMSAVGVNTGVHGGMFMP
ncbi:hypothetical protein HanOQP8_Chr05g0192361 [Helianthus annuus]|nr:hypothetical protein HanOQP8_Chr05g0192361 [Helianthus annuus]